MTSVMEDVDPVRRTIMAAVRSRDTKPELVVRKMLHSMNYRYRLHRNDLPGSPDIVFGPRRKVIFVHGCFWHRHVGCSKATTPKTRIEFWNRKFEQNVERDRKAELKLSGLGWRAITIWECETREREALEARLSAFLDEAA